MSLEDEVKALRREVNHLFDVVGAQRENMTKALQGVQVSLLEQEMTMRSQLQKVLDLMERFAVRADEQSTLLQDHEARLRKLEEQPPAA